MISFGGEKKKKSQATNCGYDWAGKVLQHLLPNVPGSNITEIGGKDEDWKRNGILRRFNQLEFIDWKDRLAIWKNGFLFSYGLDNFGYIFYPN